MDLSDAVREWAVEVGPTGPVEVVGGGTGLDVGRLAGPAPDGLRSLRAPAEHLDHRVAELTVEVDAGVTLGRLRATLAEQGQGTILAGDDQATVGGSLAVGLSGIDRLGEGHVRDALLGAQLVGADGRPFTAGGATVKNVAGYDLCRLVVGSLGTLALLGRVVLRTVPLPEQDEWWSGRLDPFALADLLWRPTAILWDGTACWVHLRGSARYVEEQAALVRGTGRAERVAGPPPLPPHRWSMRPSEIRSLDLERTGTMVAEVGVGVVHAERPAPSRAPDPVAARWAASLRDRFDPERRLNPGREPGRS